MSKGKKIIGFIALIVVLGVGTFAGVYFGLSKSEGEEKKIVIQEAFHEVGEIFVNLSDDNAKRYVKLKLSASYDEKNKDLGAEIEKKHVVMRDVANTYFSTCKAIDFEPINREKLKSDLIARLNQKLTGGTIIDIYISEIIVQ
ncbi:MAG: flagellar basal body-associated FliL family protein [Clostridium sp.]